MSWDVNLICECCNRVAYDANYTYNMSPMFSWALGSESLDELNGLRGSEAVEFLKKGIVKCEEEGELLSRFNAKNGWGDWKTALQFLRDIKEKAAMYPNTIIRIT